MADATNKTIYPETMWAGSQHSFDLAVQAHTMIMAAGADLPNQDQEDTPFNFMLHGNVGVVEIKGPLTNRDSPWNRYYGVTSYGDVRNAVIHAANHPDVKAILLDIDSGGGAVNGVADTGDFISMIDSTVKPVYALTDGTMASAAYWLGSSARKVYASKVSTVGSIGVISTHMEYSKALKEAGVNVTVLRAGQYKALINSVEPLTKVAIEQAMAQLETAYGIFLGHVASRRHVTVETADQVMGQGREFMGEAAVGAGLIDGISNFDQTIAMISAQLLDSTQVTESQYGRHMQIAPMKTALTPNQIAAAQAGVVLPSVVDAAQATTPTEAAPTNQAATEPAAAAAAATEPAPKADQTALVALLQTQLDAANRANIDLRVELAQATTKVESLTAAQAGLKQIVAGSLSTMRVALSLGKVDLSTMSAETLVAEHAAMSTQFTESFKVGGVAQASSSDETVKPVAPKALDPRMVAATRITPSKT